MSKCTSSSSLICHQHRGSVCSLSVTTARITVTSKEEKDLVLRLKSAEMTLHLSTIVSLWRAMSCVCVCELLPMLHVIKKVILKSWAFEIDSSLRVECCPS